ncbi:MULTISPECIES: cyclic nucleotide-binding domain-containing protein [Kitasatospora]|uniref:Putative nucleotide-binding protein n=1 Tax=Kitasatospora setae (strain ATCC 33774 / DSM 43861 / JCM 3304 / KCC A-0304 / NBRC 14216 / KM-6054) TaxID=452652 RepID=E4N525_KITSK|nr:MULTISPECIES: cyclic nucleotide-binding domain-containing protein [Kitasatospora]BAJ26306.1 putative nucleotide-binding protein [Kitasatospora setae KM-6054]
MTTGPDQQHRQGPRSLSTSAARNLATTTKTAPQMLGITPRYLLRALPWVELEAGVYRVNRRRGFILGDGLVSSYQDGDGRWRVIAEDLRELPLLSQLDGPVLAALADAFTEHEIPAGQPIVAQDAPADRLHVLAHGRAEKRATGAHGADALLEVLGDGDYFDAAAWAAGRPMPYRVTAASPCTVLTLDRRMLLELADREPALRARLDAFDAAATAAGRTAPEHPLDLTSGHHGEPYLPETFVDYEESPRAYELSIAQTVLKVHTRVWKQPAFFLAHPRAIAAFGRECTRRGVPPQIVELFGSPFLTWRGVPLLPSDTLDLRGTADSAPGTTNILLMRVGEDRQGVVGLRPAKVPDEAEPGLSVRPMGVDRQAITSYLVTGYFSVAALVDDAIAVLQDVEVAHYHDYS